MLLNAAGFEDGESGQWSRYVAENVQEIEKNKEMDFPSEFQKETRQFGHFVF